MLLEIPAINQYGKTAIYQTRDKKQFTSKEEATWHELTVCQLKQRKLTVEIPEHTIYTFTEAKEIEEYVAECYSHLNYTVTPSLDQLVTPNNYVVTEKEVIKDGKNYHEVIFQSLEDFKRDLARSILSDGCK